IVEACVKLFPLPPERAPFTMRAGNLGIARDLRRSMLRSPLDPMRFVLFDARAGALLNDSAQPEERRETELWIELGGAHRVIEGGMRELRRMSAAVGATLARREEAEGAWQRVANLALWLQPKYPDVTVLKAALPLVASEEFFSRAHQEAESERMAISSFAQVGVGIIHLCALQETLTSNLMGWVSRLRLAAVDLGGMLVIEHCPVALKSNLDVWGPCG